MQIAIKESVAAALRKQMEQITNLQSQLQGAVNALAAVYDVPAGWRFDMGRMVFVEPNTDTNMESSDAIAVGRAAN
jgi:hypothetical protein